MQPNHHASKRQPPYIPRSQRSHHSQPPSIFVNDVNEVKGGERGSTDTESKACNSCVCLCLAPGGRLHLAFQSPPPRWPLSPVPMPAASPCVVRLCRRSQPKMQPNAAFLGLSGPSRALAAEAATPLASLVGTYGQHLRSKRCCVTGTGLCMASRRHDDSFVLHNSGKLARAA